MINFELSENEVEIYRGRQWIVTNYGMYALGRNYILDRATVGGHCPNYHNPEFEYSCVSHVGKKVWADLEDFIIAFRVACSCYEVDTAGWLNREIEHARETRRYSAAADAVRKELFPKEEDWFCSIEELIEEEDAVEAELAKRGIIDPDARRDEPAKQEEAR
jgi:hypothetical protein